MNKKYLIEKLEFFHILTDMDSTALKFIFISDPNSSLPEDKFRDVTFQAIVTSKIYKRFDTSLEFVDVFGARKEETNLGTMEQKIGAILHINFGS